jgi:hypothetical protein
MAQVNLLDGNQNYLPGDPLGMPDPSGPPAQVRQAYSGPVPEGYSQGEVEDFLRRNPGDEHRVASALSPKRRDEPAAPAQQAPNYQFDDHYSKQLEGIASAQMGQVRSNPGLDQLMTFLNQQFTNLSTNPGYSHEDLSLLNTQAFEPIEARRHASQQRVMERTAARGFMPSSGLTEDMAQQVDMDADRQRTVAGRDLGIQAIGQRRADLGQAMDIGRTIGLEIPKSQRAEELMLAQLLYNMPRQSLQDLMMVLNGSPNSSDLFGQSLQSQQAQLQAQQRADAQNAALMEQIGQMLGSLFGGR